MAIPSKFPLKKASGAKKVAGAKKKANAFGKNKGTSKSATPPAKSGNPFAEKKAAKKKTK